MDYIDIDQVTEVPDTPDRLEDSTFNKNESNSIVNNTTSRKDRFDEVYRSSRDRSKLVTHSGNRRLFFRSQNTSKPALSASGESLSEYNPLMYGKMTENKSSEYQSNHSSHSRALDKGKSVCSSNSQRPPYKEGTTVVDLTQQNGSVQAYQKVISNRAPKSDEFRKQSLSGNIPPLHSNVDCLRKTSCNSSQGEEVEYTSKAVPSLDRGKGVNLTEDDPPKAVKTNSAFVRPSISSKVTGKKRLVRNGCISPLNIAKTKHSAESHNSKTVANEEQHGGVIVSPDAQSPSAVSISELIADGNDAHRYKGKGVSQYPFPSEKADLRSMHMPRRNSVTIREAAVSAAASQGVSKSIEGLDGWRTTHSRTKKIAPHSANDDSHISRGMDESCFVNKQNNIEPSRRDHRSGLNARNDFLGHRDTIPLQNVSAPPHMSAQDSRRGQMLGQFNARQQTANTLPQRLGQGSSSSTDVGCSTSAFDDSEIEFLSPHVVHSRARSARNHNPQGIGSWDSVIEVDAWSPEMRNSGPSALRSCEDSGVRARQVEADEMLARELQEQLYNEFPGVEIGETDEHIALAMQQEERLQNIIPDGAHPVFPPSGSSRAYFLRQSQVQPTQGPPIRSNISGRVHASTRMAGLRGRGRGRFPGRSRTLSSRSRDSLFPANMDVDMRMRILEALEAFSEVGVPNQILQADRDFNEDDYEMLLALDENNHQHGGASHGQINGLPQSIVQNDNLEECSVCLETPTLGETIRHLPCLHKFHKDCIDPWLRRRSSCPVCKSSIT